MFVLDVPSQPQQFQTTAATSTTISISWSASDSQDLPVRNYTLYIKERSADSYHKSDLYIPGTKTQAKLTQLNPSTDYFMQLEAVNDIGMNFIVYKNLWL